MNKLFTKVATLCVGLAMAAGVGVAVGSAKASEAKAGYALAYTFDFDAASTGTSSELTADTAKTFFNAAIDDDIVDSCSNVSKVYSAKGSGGAGIPDKVFKMASSNYAGTLTFELVTTADEVSKAVFSAYNWPKKAVDLTVNGVQVTKASATAASLDTFEFEFDATRTIAITCAKDCALSIVSLELYKNDGGTPSTQYNVLGNITNGSLTAPAKINESATLNATIVPAEGYDLPTSVDATMGGNPVVISYNTESGVVTIQNVLGDIVISATCPEKDPAVEPEVLEVSLAEFIASTETDYTRLYHFSAEVKAFKNGETKDQYGNMTLTDGTNDLAVYGSTVTASALSFSTTTGLYSFENPRDFITNETTNGINVGDTVEVKFVRYVYNNKLNGQGIILSVTPGQHEEYPEPALVETTLAEFIASDDADYTNLYHFTAEIKAFKSGDTKDQYGNMTLTDGTYDLAVYGSTVTESSVAWGKYTGTYSFTNPRDFTSNEFTNGLAVGDTIEVKFLHYHHNDVLQGQGIIVSKVTPVEDKYEVSFYEGTTKSSSGEYAEGAKVIMPQPTESLIPEGMVFDYWSHKETGNHYAPGEEFTVGANNARFDAVYKAIEPVPTDWTDNQKAAFKAALDQFVPPYFKEPTSVSIEGNTVTVSYDGKLDEELEEYFVEPEWTVVQAEEAFYLKKVTTNGEIRVTIGGQVGEVSTTVLTYTFVASAPSEDWSNELKEAFANALDGFVPPFVAAFSGENVFTIVQGQAYGMVAGNVVSDVTAAFVKAGYGEPEEKQGALGYEIPTTNGTVTAGYMYYEQAQSTYFALMYQAAPTGSWSEAILKNFADELHGVVPTYDDAVASLAYIAQDHDFEMPAADQETAQGYLDILCKDWDYYAQGGFYYCDTEDGLGYVRGYLYPESETTYSATIVFVQTAYDKEQSQAFVNVLGLVPPYISDFPQYVYDSNSGMFASKAITEAKYLSYYQEEIEDYQFVLVSTEAAKRFVYNGGKSGYYDGTAYSYAARLQDGGLLVMELFVIQNYYLTLNIYYEAQALSISVGGDYKTVYEYGEKFDSTGIVVTAAMSDGSSLDVTSEVEFSGFDSSVIGEQTITVTLSDLTTSFTITVNKPAYDAEAFAQELLDEIAPICANYDGKKSNKTALTSVWTKMAVKYNSLTNEEKAKLAATVGKQGGNTLERAIAFYNYACKKYGLTKFIVGQKAQALVSEQPSTNNNILPIIVIVASSVAAVTAIGVVIGLKRRKNLFVK